MVQIIKEWPTRRPTKLNAHLHLAHEMQTPRILHQLIKNLTDKIESRQEITLNSVAGLQASNYFYKGNKGQNTTY